MGTMIGIISFAIAVAVISASLGYLIGEVKNLETNVQICLREIQNLHIEIYHWFDAVSGETRHTRKIIEEIDKRV